MVSSFRRSGRRTGVTAARQIKVAICEELP